jgi:hypothetical protein
LQFNQARDLIKKLIKRLLLFHLYLINTCNVKMFSKRSSAINWILSGQLQFSYRLVIKNDNQKKTNQKNGNQKNDMIRMIIKRMI